MYFLNPCFHSVSEIWGSSLLSLLWILLSGKSPISSKFLWSYRFLPCSFICNVILSFHLCWWVRLCSCLAWGIQLWSLRAAGWSEVLVPRWGPLGALTMMNIPWSPKFSSSPVAQILCSHHSGLGPTPGLGNQTLQATLWQKRKKNV